MSLASKIALALLLATPAFAAEKVSIGYTRTATDVAMYVADKRGYFKDEGLDVTFNQVASASMMIAPLTTGDVDVMAGSPSAGLFNATLRGLDVRLVASKVTTPPGYTSQTLIVRKSDYDSGAIKKIADLKGKKIANGSPGTGALGTLNRMFKTAGMTLEDVELATLTFPQMLPALINGAVVAALPAEPYTMQAVREGVAVPLMRDDEVYPGHEIASYIMGGRFYRDRRPVAVKFLKAVLRGARDHNDALDDKGFLRGAGSDAIVSIISEYTGIGGSDPSFFKSYALAYCDPDGKISVASLKEDLALFNQLGLIEGEGASVEKIVDDTLRQDAVKELGAYVKKR